MEDELSLNNVVVQVAEAVERINNYTSGFARRAANTPKIDFDNIVLGSTVVIVASFDDVSIAVEPALWKVISIGDEYDTDTDSVNKIVSVRCNRRTKKFTLDEFKSVAMTEAEYFERAAVKARADAVDEMSNAIENVLFFLEKKLDKAAVCYELAETNPSIDAPTTDADTYWKDSNEIRW